MKWTNLPSAPIPASLAEFKPLVAQALLQRGITTLTAARAFLDTSAYRPTQASDLPGLSQTVERVGEAIQGNEPICVWGDFDVDGQTATALLVQTLAALDANVTYHIPVRARESHGINIEHLAPIIDGGARLILTCDTGITSNEAVNYARSRGVDVAISDHHDLPATLPQATTITNPKLLPPEHPLASLSGVGVTYQLAMELLSHFPSHSIDPDVMLDLVALGLVTDLALLKGDTRYLVQRGLNTLRNTKRLGLQVMMELAELQPGNLTETHISFVLGPRLNALGRLGDANSAVELLITSDPARARLLATQLEGLNAQRQLLTSQVHQAAESQLRADPSLLEQPAIVLAHPAWPGGVVGIVASKLVERYQRPVVLLTTPADEPARGSARSIPGVNITAAIAAQQDLLLSFGGHPMAAGLSLAADKLAEFQHRFASTIGRMVKEAHLEEPSLKIEAWLDLPALTIDLAKDLEALAPFGPGNPQPVLATRQLKMQNMQAIGRNNEHLKLSIEDASGNKQQVLWWDGAGEFMGAQPASPLQEGRFNLAYTMRASTWRGHEQVTIEFVDFQPLEEKAVEVKRRKIEGVDYRSAKNPLDILRSLPKDVLIWAEGEHKAKVGGVDRLALVTSPCLVIWTTPAGPAELSTGLDIVKPGKVFLFANAPEADQVKSFLNRLAGLVKYALNQRSGESRLTELAAATAQRTTTVRFGLEWLAAGGHLTLEVKGEEIRLSAGDTTAYPQVQGEFFTALQALLAETSAYRAYFASADKDALLED